MRQSESSGKKVDERPLRRELIGAGKWIELHRIYFQDVCGKERIWELASRVSKTQAVMIAAYIEPGRRWLLVRQFRAPACGFVIEFPAGLIDNGETPERAAERELMEETGYELQVESVFPPSFNSPGLTDESVWVVIGRAQIPSSASSGPQPQPDPDEQIEVITVPQEHFVQTVLRWAKEGYKLDSKVLAFALGLAVSKH